MTSNLRQRNDEIAPFLIEAAFIGGAWVSDAHAKLAVTNPADGTILGHVPQLTSEHVDQAIASASSAWPQWRSLRSDERAQLLHFWDSLIRDNLEPLARLLTYEQGKPLAESRDEVEYARSFISWFAEEGRRHYGDIIPSHLPDSRLFVMREPIGVVAAVTPWNFPCAMVTRKASAAMAVGCPVIVVPSSQTPFSAIALAELARRAGIPPGVFSVLTGDSRQIAHRLCHSNDVRALSFTGSTEVGRLLMQESARNIKKVSLELGGHAPFIVFDDADIEKAIDGCIKAKFTTGGQDCLAANRIYVHRRIYDEFASRLTTAAAALNVGPGWIDGTNIGPMVHSRAVEKCDDHVRDAVGKNAKLMLKGGVKAPGSLYYHPAILGDVNDSMKIYHEETFGPVAPLVPFDDGMDIARLANDTIYGLAAYVYTRDVARAWDVVESLDYGIIAVNSPKMTGAPIPFGGYKQSGLGREGSRFGIEEFSQIKYFCWNRG